MHRPLVAVRTLAVALGVGLAAELLLDGHALGINVFLATSALLAAVVVAAGGVRRLDPLDAWIPAGALILAAFPAIRDDAPLVLLDVTGALGLAGASVAAFAGCEVTRRMATAVVGLAARVAAASMVGAVALAGRLREEADVPTAIGRATRLAPVLRGLAIVVPLLLLFATLFASADPIFQRGLDDLLSVDVALGELPARLLFTAVATWIAAGLLWFVIAARPEIEPRSLGAAAGAATVSWFRLGAVEAVTILVALDLLFAAFVALQVAYLFGGLDTLGAIGMTYANYARRGFFELLAVVGLVGGLLLSLENFVAHRTRAYVAAALALVGLSAVVLASSLKRLALYQEAYGWTELRFYVVAAIGFFAICLAAAAVLIFRNRSRWLPHAIAMAALGVLVAVNVAGPQATVTDRNLERSLVPSVVPEYGEATLDTPYLVSLGADAIPALVAALPGLPADAQARLRPALRDAWNEYVRGPRDSWQGWNLARERARDALEALFGP